MMEQKDPRFKNSPTLKIPKDATPEEAARLAREFAKELKKRKLIEEAINLADLAIMPVSKRKPK